MDYMIGGDIKSLIDAWGIIELEDCWYYLA